MTEDSRIESDSTADDLTFYSLLGVLQSGMWLHSDIEKHLGKYKLSHGRFSILLSLVESPDKTLVENELAAKLGVGKPAVAKMISKLLNEGYLSYTSDSQDLRKKKYTLTDTAQAALGKIIPGYLTRLREIGARLSDADKKELIEILAKINFPDQCKKIIREKNETITEKCFKIRDLCKRGLKEDIDRVLAYLDNDADLPTTKVVDFYLGTVKTIEGTRRIEHYLFHGTQIQRNYCTLFFARMNEWRIVNRAYDLGLIDYAQAYSR